MNKLPVFYTPKQVADSGAYSPSAAKPKQLVEHWQATGFPIEIHEPVAATEAQFCRVHDPEFARGVLGGWLPNGFGNHRTDVALSLPWTSGSLLSAARYAVAHPEAPAPCSPTSGFHHSGYGFGSGFCSLNGLMVAAVALLGEKCVRRVGILDLDAHYSNGTDDIIDRLDLHERVQNYSVGAHYTTPEHAARFLRELPEIVTRMVVDCDIVIYQAGQDLHREDPLGGVLSTEEMTERDRIVFGTARMFGTPCCFNLAGGYRRDADGGIRGVLAGHTNTAKAALWAAGVK